MIAPCSWGHAFCPCVQYAIVITRSIVFHVIPGQVYYVHHIHEWSVCIIIHMITVKGLFLPFHISNQTIMHTNLHAWINGDSRGKMSSVSSSSSKQPSNLIGNVKLCGEGSVFTVNFTRGGYIFILSFNFIRSSLEFQKSISDILICGHSTQSLMCKYVQ